MAFRNHREKAQIVGGYVLAVVAVVTLSAASDTGEHVFTSGEILTLCGFLLTCAAILWRGGRLEGVLNRLERDVARLSVTTDETATFRRLSESDRATMHAQIIDLERRMESIEKTCIAMHHGRAREAP